MNGLDIIVWNYYIGEQKMVKDVIFSIKNVIIKDLLYVYAKMKKGIFLEDMLPYLGLLMVIIIMLMEAFYLP